LRPRAIRSEANTKNGNGQQRHHLDTADHTLPDDQVRHERMEDVLRQHRRNADDQKDLRPGNQQADGKHDQEEDDHGVSEMVHRVDLHREAIRRRDQAR
jgi:hypothetical protein